jgi:NodT family efflux transporter outer membrane factor (OMF) lipoprotein
MKKIILLNITALSLFTHSCTLGPNFKAVETKADTQEKFLNISDDYQAQYSMKNWWDGINDPLLKTYIDQLLDENLDLKEAAERIIQARENLAIQRGGRMPEISADLSGNRSFTPTSANNFLPQTSKKRFFNNSNTADLNVSWQLDFFGKMKRTIEAGESEFSATIHDRDALIHSLIAELVNLRVAIASNNNSLELAKDNAKNRQKVYDLVQKRYQLGAKNTYLSDVYLAEEDYNLAQGEVHEFERLLAADIYNFDILLGQVPGTTTPLSSTFALLPPPVDIPIGLPANLLDRRPDLRAAQLRVKAANANIGVAIADLYPSLSLGASLGFAQGNSGSLFGGIDQIAGSLFGSITTKLFQGGTLRANIRLQKSEVRELTANYSKLVLNALREVETALKAEQELGQKLDTIRRSVIALQDAESLSETRYLTGIMTLNEFLNMKQKRYLAEKNWITIQQQQWNNRLELYLALGGDWLDEKSKESLKKKLIYHF